MAATHGVDRSGGVPAPPSVTPPGRETVLEVRGVCKRFPGVLALDRVDFDVRRGEVHVLLGENGAGKSTLMKILSGAYRKDEGEILIEGRPVEIENPRHAQRLGIAIIYQNFNQVPHLNVLENLFLGREVSRLGFIDFDEMSRRARVALDRVGLRVDLRARIMDLSIAQRQMIEIARALSLESQIIIMDEPTSALTDREVQTLFGIIESLRAREIATVYISHRLEEVKRIGDRVTVLRDGQKVGTLDIADADVPTMIRLMVGRELSFENIEKQQVTGPEMLRVEQLCRKGVLRDVSFSIRRGEIVSLFGLMGAGRTEVARAIFGVDSIDTGQVFVEGQPVTISSPRAAVRHGLGFLTEDRLRSGLAMSLSVAHNITLPSLPLFRTAGMLLNLRAERRAATDYIGALDVQTPGPDQQVQYLSGGNQQKVVLAKWLMAQSKILILDEPTQGIDVGAKEEVHRLMIDFAHTKNGAVLLISSDLPEVLRMSDRILVMHDGSIVADVHSDQASQELIMEYATGSR